MIRISGDFRDKAWWNLLVLAYVLAVLTVVLVRADDLPGWMRACIGMVGIALVVLLVGGARSRLRGRRRAAR